MNIYRAIEFAEQSHEQREKGNFDQTICRCRCSPRHCESWSAVLIFGYSSGFAASMWCRGDEVILLHVLPQQTDSCASGAPPVDILTVASPLPHSELVQQAQQHIEDSFLPSTLDLSPTPTVKIVTVSAAASSSPPLSLATSALCMVCLVG